VARRSWRPLVWPAVFLLAVTVAVVALRGVLHRSTAPPPAAPPHAARTPAKHPPPARRHVYTVRAGDTLSAIAATTGVPLARIRALNPGLAPTALFIGEKIRLP
jgi:hypothetical protein